MERMVLEGQCLGIALGEPDQLPEPLRLGQLGSLAQQEWVHIGPGDGVGIAEPSRQQANQRTGAAADFEDRLARPRPDLVDQGSEHRLIGRHAGAVLERRDAAQMGTAEGDDREVPGQSRDCRRPLRRRQKKRQQHQRRAGALDAVGNAGMPSFRRACTRPVGALPICGQMVEKSDHPVSDLVGAVGDGIAPAAGSLVAGKDRALRGRQAGDRKGRGFRGRPTLTGDHQNPIGHVGERRRVEAARHAQHDPGQSFGMRCCQPRDVSRDRRAEIRRGEAQMVHQRNQPIGRRHIGVLHRIPLSYQSSMGEDLAQE